MMRKYIIGVLLLVLAGCAINPIADKTEKKSYEIPMAGNGWYDNFNENDRRSFTEHGLQGWNLAEREVWIYFFAEKAGEVSLSLNAKVNFGKSKLSVSLNGNQEEIELNNTEFKEIPVGKFQIMEPGYQKVIVKGIEKAAGVFADIKSLGVSIPKQQGNITFVKDDFYWGRRGPSVHFSYTMPEIDIKWLYNEITVPVGSDVIGSYYMANGFAEGYFGIQVNSSTERRILFSVWSSFDTDDPESIPDEQKIVLLKKGEEVYTGEFGNEGSGGQSYKKYNWKAGNTYKFLTKIEPSPKPGSSEYTSYFYAPEKGSWELIASFRRPETTTYAKRFHSFLENFITGAGHKTRNVFFSNQWVADTDGNWTELTQAKFTADATARKGNRLDYAGKVTDGKFELINCGFFWPNVAYDTFMEREPTFQKPAINWEEIESL